MNLTKTVFKSAILSLDAAIYRQVILGIGKRLDGWANRDLNVGAIVSPFSELLGTDVATVKKVLESWGPGCLDAELDKDGKALRPDGKRACTLIPPAFGLVGLALAGRAVRRVLLTHVRKES